MVLAVGMVPLGILAYVLTTRRQPGSTLRDPVVLFGGLQLLFVFGTVRLMIDSSSINQSYLAVITLSLVAFFSGALSVAALSASALRRTQYIGWPSVEDRVEALYASTSEKLLWRIAVASSIIITIAYYSAVGYNVFFLQVTQWVSGITSEATDIASMRLAAYAGERYLAPGYVNQFKNTLLPIIAGAGLIYSWNSPDLRWRTTSTALMIFTVLALIGTGQRSPLVFAAGAWIMLGMSRLRGPTRISFLTVALTAAVGLLLLTTVLLGRRGPVAWSLPGLMGVFLEVADRFLESGQRAGLVGFEYVHTLPIQWGSEWLDSFRGILPGRAGSSLANEVFAVMFGGGRGTAPVSIWTSFWHNWSWPGLLVGGYSLGALYAWVGRGLRRARGSLVEDSARVTIVVILATWTSGAPVTLLNKGLLMAVGVLVVSKALRRRAESTNSTPKGNRYRRIASQQF